MTHYEVAFRLQHEKCPYNAFSKAYPEVVVSHWCNWSRDVLEIAGRDLQEANVQRGIQELTEALGSKIIRRTSARSNVQVVLMHCACDAIPPPTLPVIERRNCLEMQPAIYTGGWESYRVIAFSERDIARLFRDLEDYCDVEVVSRRAVSEESIRETFLLSVATLFGDLTEKQTEALVRALDNGYYQLPRKLTAGEIAERLGLPRTSFVDHLRKGENKVLRALGPYLRLKP